MKKDDFSFFEIFQDPLMTIIALVLLGTAWMIFPGESKPGDPAISAVRGEADSLRKEVEAMEEKLKRVKLEYQKFAEISSGLQKAINGAIEVSDKNKTDIDLMSKKIAVIENSLREKTEELRQLEDELKKIKVLLDSDGGIGDIERIRDKINKLTQQIEEKYNELIQIEEKIKELNKSVSSTSMDQKESEVAQLQNNLKMIQGDIDKLEKEYKELELVGGGGCIEVSPTQKKPFYIELINNRLFPVDEDHYYIKHGYLSKNGNYVGASESTRKSSIQGESIVGIQRHESKLYKVLQKLNPEKDRVYFLVHEDSFEIYRKARKIVLKEGIEVTWWPFKSKSIVMTYGGSKDGEGDDVSEHP